MKECSEALKKYPKGDMGMVPDNIRKTEQYQIDKNAYDAAFKRLQKVNQWFMKNFKKEYMKGRKALAKPDQSAIL